MSLSEEFVKWLNKEAGPELSSLLIEIEVTSAEDIAELTDDDINESDVPKNFQIELRRLRERIRRGHVRTSSGFKHINSEENRLHPLERKINRQSASGIDASILAKQTKLQLNLKPNESLVNQLKRKGELLCCENDLDIFLLPVKNLLLDEENRIAVKEVDLHHVVKSCEIVILLVGATGAGKTTLINAIANFVYGVGWKDDFRFKLVGDERSASQVHSQTKWMTAYTFNWHPDSQLTCTLTIVDSPGFGDTAGIGEDKTIVEQINSFFSIPSRQHRISHIHGIGFVTPATTPRLTATQKYIFDSVLGIFGKDVSNNIFLMTTFADGNQPPVLEAAKAHNIPFTKYFKFNNSALFCKQDPEADDDGFQRGFWKMGSKNLDRFFEYLQTISPSNLYLTKEVLQQRTSLAAKVRELHEQIQDGLLKTEELQQEREFIQKHACAIEANQTFTDTITITKQRKVNLKLGTHVTNCLSCNFTCHYPCTIGQDEKKGECDVMQNGYCRSCPQHCHWNKHYSNTFRFEFYTDTETRTFEDLKAKFTRSQQDMSVAESMVQHIKVKLVDMQGTVARIIGEAQNCMNRLEEIALKATSENEYDYIDILITSEKAQHEPGWQSRVRSLEVLRQQACIVSNVKDQTCRAVPLPQSPEARDGKWLQDIIRMHKVKL